MFWLRHCGSYLFFFVRPTVHIALNTRKRTRVTWKKTWLNSPGFESEAVSCVGKSRESKGREFSVLHTANKIKPAMTQVRAVPMALENTWVTLFLNNFGLLPWKVDVMLSVGFTVLKFLRRDSLIHFPLPEGAMSSRNVAFRKEIC